MSRLAAVLSLLLLADTAWAGCTRDTDCKGDRICEAGHCTAPKAKAPATSTAEVKNGRRRVHRISVLGALILPTKLSGRCWDQCTLQGQAADLAELSAKIPVLSWKAALAGFAAKGLLGGVAQPDPYVRLDVGTAKIRTRRVQDTLQPIWNGPVRVVQLTNKTQVNIAVWDKDLSDDDPIGHTLLRVPDAIVRNGGAWKVKPFGRVHSLTLRVEVVEAPMSAAARPVMPISRSLWKLPGPQRPISAKRRRVRRYFVATLAKRGYPMRCITLSDRRVSRRFVQIQVRDRRGGSCGGAPGSVRLRDIFRLELRTGLIYRDDGKGNSNLFYRPPPRR